MWGGVKPADPVRALAARVERTCQAVGLQPERRAFHPHITLAGWRGPRSREVRAFLDGRGLSFEPWGAGAFTLFESHLSRHGAHYEAMESFRLT